MNAATARRPFPETFGVAALLVATAWAFLPLELLPSFDAVKLGVLAALLAALSFAAARRRGGVAAEDALRDPLLLVPAVTAVAAAVAAVSSWPRGSLQGPALAIACVAAARLAPGGTDGLRATLRGLCVASLGVSLYALLQVAGLDPSPWGPRREVVSTLGNTSSTAEFQAAALAASVARSQSPCLSRPGLILALAAAALAALHLVLAKSRIDLVAAAAGLAAVFFVAMQDRKRARLFALGGAVLLAGAAALFVAAAAGHVGFLGRGDTLQVRLHIWEATLRLFADDPFRFGTAPFVDLYPPWRDPEEYRLSLGRVVDTPHCDLLEIAATLGTVGLAAALLWIAACARRLAALRAERPFETAALAGMFVALAVSGLASSPLTHPTTALLLALAAGHVVALAPRPVLRRAPRARTADFVACAAAIVVLWPGPALRTLRADGFFALGMKQRRAGEAELAAGLLDAACAVDPQHDLARYELGTLLFSRGRADEAVAALRSAHEIRPNEPDIRTNLVYALREAGRTDPALRAEAEQFLDASLALFPWHPLLRTARASRSSAAGDYAAAKADLDAAASLRPADLRVRAVRAEAALGAEPDETSRTEALETLVAIRAAGDFQLLTQAARAFAARDPVFLAVLAGRARRTVEKDPSLAVTLVVAPIDRLTPPDAGYFADAAKVLQSAGHAEESRRLLGRSLGLRGQAAYTAGDTDEALRLARQAADRDPIPEHRVLEALCLARAGERLAVRDALAAAASLGPIDAARIRADPAFARLLPDADLESLLAHRRLGAPQPPRREGE